MLGQKLSLNPDAIELGHFGHRVHYKTDIWFITQANLQNRQLRHYLYQIIHNLFYRQVLIAQQVQMSQRW